MAQLETWIRQDLKKPLQVQYLSGTMFSQDNAANLVGVEVFDDGEPATLGGSVSANVVRSDGGTVAVSSGTVSGNKVSVVLPHAAYAIPGQISIIIKLTTSGTVTTLGAIVVTVYRSSTDTVVDPGTIIPSVQNLISQIETAVASIPADYSSLWASLAPAFSNSTAYTAGQCVTYNGHLYRFTANHAAGSFVNTDCTQVDVGSELSALKSALNDKVDKVEYLHPTFVRGSRNSSGELVASNYRISNDMVLAEDGLYLKITPSNNQQIEYFLYDGTRSKMIGSVLFSSEFNFVCPIGCYYQFVVRYTNEAQITPNDLSVVFEIVPQEKIIDNSYKDSIDSLICGENAGIPLQPWQWYNKSYNQSTMAIVSNDNTMLTMIEPIVVKADRKIVVTPSSGFKCHATFYTEDGTTKTKLYSKTWSTDSIEFTSDTDCYLSVTQGRTDTSARLYPVDGAVTVTYSKQDESGDGTDAELRTAIENESIVIDNTYVRGSGNTDGTISPSTYRLVTSDFVYDTGIFTLVPNGLRTMVRVFDTQKEIMRSFGWNSSDITFCVPKNCYYTITIQKADESTLMINENVTVLYKKTNTSIDASTNKTILDNFGRNPSNIQLRADYIDFWNKRLGTDLTYAISSDRICNIEPIAIKDGESITVAIEDDNLRISPTIYTEIDNVKTKIYSSDWSSNDFYYTATTDCYLVFNLSFSSGNITSMDANVKIFKTITQSSGTLPSYWIEYLDEKIPSIKSNIVSVGNQGDTFMLVTDTHWENNRKKSPAVMKYLKEKTNISFSVNCGDLIQGTATANEALNFLDDYNEQIKNAEPFYCVRGNHDTNMDGAYQTGEITEGQFYAIIDKPIEFLVDTKQKPYFYKDNESQKIRYIFVDSEKNRDINATWIGNVVANTPDGYSIVVFSHYLFTGKPSSDTSPLEISSQGQLIINAIDTNKPENVTVVGIFGGHAHRDYYTHSSEGYLLVCTTCDANAAYGFDPDNPNRTEGTTSEQAIDVVSINTYSKTVDIIRIGAGSSRTNLSYGE